MDVFTFWMVSQGVEVLVPLLDDGVNALVFATLLSCRC